MKGSGTLVASMVAASTMALSSSSSPTPSAPVFTRAGGKKGGQSSQFEPRFDGLRFIETLVTAHR
ncbi:uncharacterized protein LOC126793311 [Argentina anserina]|uniref:uncharacterized protein LOC126793311 n=1 Tax=Argentina anserina TaxID=57926 RepID=UPI00217631C5|nr:uncharacterized protein LOC126793311 [Potentilla anserina]